MARRRLSALVLAALLPACALGPYSPSGVPASATRDEVVRIMGPPTATYTMADGHQRLEYSRVPAGRQTFMVDLDESGRMAHWENVLDENHFDALRPGMTTAEVLRLVGPPTFTSQYRLPAPGITWNWRFQTIQRCIVFQLAFDAATGKVLEGAYPPDPGCSDQWM